MGLMCPRSVAILAQALFSHSSCVLCTVRRHMVDVEAVETKEVNKYTGTAEQLFQKLLPFARKHGISFCKYDDENTKVAAAKLVHGKEGVEGHRELLSLLHDSHASLSFNKLLMEQALAKIPEECGWKLSAEEAVDWHVTIARRMRNMCRVVSQAQLKMPWPTWICELPWNAGGEAASKATSKSGPRQAVKGKTADVSSYTFSYDNELQLPVRTRGGIAEPGLPMTADSEVNEAGFLLAEWPDGLKAAMDGMTPEALREMIRSPATASTGELFGMDHSITKNHVCLRQKVDRSLLLVAYEQSKQLVMVKMNAFGRIEDERKQLAKDDAVCVAAVKFLAPLVERYCKDELKRPDLNKAKHEMLKQFTGAQKQLAGTQKKRGALKKPAAKASAQKKAKTEASGEGDDVAEDEEAEDEDAEDDEEAEDEEAEDEEPDEDPEEEYEVEAATKKQKKKKKEPIAKTIVMRRPAASTELPPSSCQRPTKAWSLTAPPMSTVDAMAQFFA